MVATVLKNLDSILRASNASADAIKQITDHCGQVLEHAIMRADTDLEAVFAGEKTLSEFIVENNGSIDNLGSSALKALNTIVATKVQHQVFRNAAATFIKNPPPGVTPDEFLKTYPDIASDKTLSDKFKKTFEKWNADNSKGSTQHSQSKVNSKSDASSTARPEYYNNQRVLDFLFEKPDIDFEDFKKLDFDENHPDVDDVSKGLYKEYRAREKVRNTILEAVENEEVSDIIARKKTVKEFLNDKEIDVSLIDEKKLDALDTPHFVDYINASLISARRGKANEALQTKTLEAFEDGSIKQVFDSNKKVDAFFSDKGIKIDSLSDEVRKSLNTTAFKQKLETDYFKYQFKNTFPLNKNKSFYKTLTEALDDSEFDKFLFKGNGNITFLKYLENKSFKIDELSDAQKNLLKSPVFRRTLQESALAKRVEDAIASGNETYNLDNIAKDFDLAKKNTVLMDELRKRLDATNSAHRLLSNKIADDYKNLKAKSSLNRHEKAFFEAYEKYDTAVAVPGQKNATSFDDVLQAYNKKEGLEVPTMAKGLSWKNFYLTSTKLASTNTNSPIEFLYYMPWVFLRTVTKNINRAIDGIDSVISAPFRNKVLKLNNEINDLASQAEKYTAGSPEFGKKQDAIQEIIQKFAEDHGESIAEMRAHLAINRSAVAKFKNPLNSDVGMRQGIRNGQRDAALEAYDHMDAMLASLQKGKTGELAQSIQDAKSAEDLFYAKNNIAYHFNMMDARQTGKVNGKKAKHETKDAMRRSIFFENYTELVKTDKYGTPIYQIKNGNYEALLDVKAIRFIDAIAEKGWSVTDRGNMADILMDYIEAGAPQDAALAIHEIKIRVAGKGSDGAHAWNSSFIDQDLLPRINSAKQKNPQLARYYDDAFDLCKQKASPSDIEGGGAPSIFGLHRLAGAIENKTGRGIDLGPAGRRLIDGYELDQTFIWRLKDLFKGTNSLSTPFKISMKDKYIFNPWHKSWNYAIGRVQKFEDGIPVTYKDPKTGNTRNTYVYKNTDITGKWENNVPGVKWLTTKYDGMNPILAPIARVPLRVATIGLRVPYEFGKFAYNNTNNAWKVGAGGLGLYWFGEEVIVENFIDRHDINRGDGNGDLAQKAVSGILNLSEKPARGVAMLGNFTTSQLEDAASNLLFNGGPVPKYHPVRLLTGASSAYGLNELLPDLLGGASDVVRDKLGDRDNYGVNTIGQKYIPAEAYEIFTRVFGETGDFNAIDSIIDNTTDKEEEAFLLKVRTYLPEIHQRYNAALSAIDEAKGLETTAQGNYNRILGEYGSEPTAEEQKNINKALENYNAASSVRSTKEAEASEFSRSLLLMARSHEALKSAREELDETLEDLENPLLLAANEDRLNDLKAELQDDIADHKKVRLKHFQTSAGLDPKVIAAAAEANAPGAGEAAVQTGGRSGRDDAPARGSAASPQSAKPKVGDPKPWTTVDDSLYAALANKAGETSSAPVSPKRGTGQDSLLQDSFDSVANSALLDKAQGFGSDVMAFAGDFFRDGGPMVKLFGVLISTLLGAKLTGSMAPQGAFGGVIKLLGGLLAGGGAYMFMNNTHKEGQSTTNEFNQRSPAQRPSEPRLPAHIRGGSSGSHAPTTVSANDYITAPQTQEQWVAAGSGGLHAAGHLSNNLIHADFTPKVDHVASIAPAPVTPGPGFEFSRDVA